MLLAMLSFVFSTCSPATPISVLWAVKGYGKAIGGKYGGINFIAIYTVGG